MHNKAAESKSVLPTPPEDVIMEQILPRLPVKTLIRFKSVSKYWLSTISTHNFVKTHLKFSSTRLQSFISYHQCIIDGSCFISFDERNNVKYVVELDYNLPSYSPSHPFRRSLSFVIGCYDGLVCLYDFGLHFYIWNPATKQCHNVSRPDFDHDLPYGMPDMGFGYVSSVDDYRIGLLIRNVEDDDLCYIYIYSLKARKWITMPSLDEDNENYDFRVGKPHYEAVVVDDTLYWPPRLPRGHEKDYYYSPHIAGLNLVNGEMKKVPMMNLINGYGEYDNEVRVFRMKGCLSMCLHKGVNGVTDVWMLKHHNNWEKVMSFDFGVKDNLLWLFENGKCLVRANFNQPMLHDDDDDLSRGARKQYEQGLIIWPGGSNKQFNLKNYVHHAWGYAESLISPFGTNLSD